MEKELLGKVSRLIETGRFEEALGFLDPELENDRDDWYLNYLAGLCNRFLGNIHAAVTHLKRADRNRGMDDPTLLLALAIAYQKQGRYEAVIDVLRRSLEADPSHVPTVNTLAMTQKLAGEPGKASVNYDNALKLIAWEVVRDMVNRRDSKIYKHEPWEEIHSAWIEYAMYAAMRLGARDNVDSIAWPSGDAAIREEGTEEHGGLYWTDQKGEDGKSVRLFWPNYFTTFREKMTGNRMYVDLIGNRSTVLRMLGEIEQADRLLAEAQFFSGRN